MSGGRIALVGDPVSASVSPAMQNAAFRDRGLPFEYEALRIPRGALPARFPALRAGYAGLNVTIPHKEEAARLVDVLEPAARASGSVNTVVFRHGRAFGDSTDGRGFLRALRSAVRGREIRSALIVGTGGAARAVAAALAGERMTVRVAGRSADAAARLARDIAGVEVAALDGLDLVLDDSDLLVSAVPAAAWDDGSLPRVPFGPELVVFDLAYRPRRTSLLERAAAEGSPTIEGIEMLIEQGALSFLLWTGVEPPRDVMREAAYDALERPVPA
ncbi:MAG TPA: shikimate dehydrogenase [Candidatus Limnocylindria bacterium]|nr:shikimate dehydrogenase [Candidatus Limnocylindria bacterium]